MKSLIWFFLGQAAFGLLIGLFVGLSVSEVVVSVIGLLFAFVGGSILVLIKGKTDRQLSVIGVSVTVLCMFIIAGTFSGIYMRVNNVLSSALIAEDKTEKVEKLEKNTYTYDEPVSINIILQMAKTGMSDESLCYLISSNVKHLKENKKLSLDQVKKLYKAKPGIKSLKAMFEGNNNCFSGKVGVVKNNTTGTQVYNIPGGSILD